jgi:uncharacterized membrane-anchored protein
VLYEGPARMGRRTKDLVLRLRPGDIAVIDHADLDRVSAESLVDAGVELVLNTRPSTTGRYPNLGPLVLAIAGVSIVDEVCEDIFTRIRDGAPLRVDHGSVFSNGRLVAEGRVRTVKNIEEDLETARAGLGGELSRFAQNTLEYLEREKGLLTDALDVPSLATPVEGRPVLVVVRGYDYKEDLAALRAYVREVKPAVIAVDGAADALLAEGKCPDILIGDMDSVSDEALTCGAELIVHAYPDGRAPGMDRIEAMGLNALTFPVGATSEDAALLLAYESGAEVIVAVGTHANMVEFLDKGRQGMASTFLVRLKVGDRLVDAKGVSRLWRATPRPRELLLLVAAALATMTVAVMISPLGDLIRVLAIKVRAALGL